MCLQTKLQVRSQGISQRIPPYRSSGNCDWVNKTNNVSFATCILEKDHNIEFSPFTPSGSKTQTPSTTTPAPSTDEAPNAKGTNNNTENASSTPGASN